MIEPYFYWILLNHIFGIGPKTLIQIYKINEKQNIKIEQVFLFSESELEEIYCFKPATIYKIRNHKKYHPKVLKTIQNLKKKNIIIISIEDKLYPKKLLEFLDFPPTVLYTYGNTGLLKKKIVGIFASRFVNWNSLYISEKVFEDINIENTPVVVGTSKEIYEYVSYLTKSDGGENIIIVNFGVYDSKLKKFSMDFRTYAKFIDKNFNAEKNLVISFVNPEYGWSISTEKEKNDIIFALSDIAFGLDVRKNGIIYNNFVKAVGSKKELYIVRYKQMSKKKDAVHSELISKGCKEYKVILEKSDKRKVDWKQLKRLLEIKDIRN